MRWREFQERCVRWESTTVHLLGIVEVVFALCLLLPTVLALYYGENWVAFAAPVAPLLVLGTVQYLAFGNSRHFRTVNGLILVALVWVVMFAICTIPYLLSGFGVLDAVFEAVSSLTTTGITTIGDPGSVDVSLLVWQSMALWIGGIAVVIIFLYFLPAVGFGRNMFQNELSGSEGSGFTQRTSDAARSFIYVYLVLSLVNLVLLLLLGVNWLEAVCLMFATISTGGLVGLSSGMASYSDPVQWVTILFMFLGGTSFYLHYRFIIRRQRDTYLRNSEFKTMVAWFLVIALVMFALLLEGQSESGVQNILDVGNLYDTFKNALFTTVSLGTTTGFYIDDFTLWPSQCLLLLMLVCIIGGSSGSTSGGIKFGRIRVLYEFVRNGFRGITNGNAVYTPKMDGRILDDAAVRSVLVVFLMYVFTIIVAAVVFMIFGYDIIDSFSLSISTLTNGGMGFGDFGPSGDFEVMHSYVKIAVIILMWIGRLEIVTAIIMFTPGFWRDVWLNSRSRRRERRERTARPHRSSSAMARRSPGDTSFIAPAIMRTLSNSPLDAWHRPSTSIAGMFLESIFSALVEYPAAAFSLPMTNMTYAASAFDPAVLSLRQDLANLTASLSLPA